MIQHIQCIQAELYVLRFPDSERLAQICVKAPERYTRDHILTERTPFSGQGVLKDDLARLSVAEGK